MARKQVVEEISNYEQIGLSLPVPERETILTSQHVSSEMQNRIREAPLRGQIVVAFEELEDLHRGLTFDRERTDDKKRRRILGKVLGKIDELLGCVDDEKDDLQAQFDDDVVDLPASPQEVFETLFAPAIDSEQIGGPMYRVTLNDEQRNALLSLDTVPGEIHKMLAVNSVEEQELGLDNRQFMTLTMAIQHEFAKTSRDEIPRPILSVAQRMSEAMFAAAEESIDADDDWIDVENSERYRQQQLSPAVAYEIKVTLQDSRPPIWRRVRIGDCTLDVLHEIIQNAMGWENYHLHAFEWNELRYSPPQAELDGDRDETQVRLSTLVKDGCKQLKYWYDFGDDWWHTIKIEKTLAPKASDQFPICIAGAGACPPEDCGGLWGYYELLEVLRNPKHERHGELFEWVGDGFDPGHFDINESNRALIG